MNYVLVTIVVPMETQDPTQLTIFSGLAYIVSSQSWGLRTLAYSTWSSPVHTPLITLLSLFICMLLLLLSHFSRVRLCATPKMAAHQAPPCLGFSRQEHWSGLPFPSPMHESEKWKWSRSVVSKSSWPRGLQPTRLLHPWDFPGKSTGVGCHCLLLIYMYKYP